MESTIHEEKMAISHFTGKKRVDHESRNTLYHLNKILKKPQNKSRLNSVFSVLD